MAKKTFRGAADHAKQLELFQQEAARLGLADDYLFQTSVDRYAMQVEIMQRLKNELDSSAATVQKSYGGASNTYASPLLSEIYKASGAADRTCALLAKLLAAAEKRAEDDGFGFEL